jgi:sensor histidine kinase regulating citrate/malate metabolism
MAVKELLQNAVDHAGKAEPTVRVAVDTPNGETGDITIAVDDDGPGIPEHKISVVSSEEETPLTHSEGIGLWMVTRTVNAANGEMSFEESDLGGTGSNWRSRRRSRRH